MEVEKTPLAGAVLLKPQKIEDLRGFFTRIYCSREFEAIGVNDKIAQINSSFSHRRGTLRGLHFQIAPFDEVKMMRCVGGAIYNVIIDLRPESETYREWYGAELSAENRYLLIVPKGFANGFQVLCDNTEVIYPTTASYSPAHERGVRWNDPAFNIKWPIENPILSLKDSSLSDFVTDSGFSSA